MHSVEKRTKEISLFVGACLAWVCLVAVHVGASFGGAVMALLGLIFVVSLLGFFITIVIGIGTRRWRVFRFFSVALFLILSSSWAASFISDQQRKASITAAQPIILAAERFHADTGAYPNSLADLAPTYLQAEPRTKMGFRGTSYVLFARQDRLHITFSLPGWMLCTYNSVSKQWRIDD